MAPGNWPGANCIRCMTRAFHDKSQAILNRLQIYRQQQKKREHTLSYGLSFLRCQDALLLLRILKPSLSFWQHILSYDSFLVRCQDPLLLLRVPKSNSSNDRLAFLVRCQDALFLLGILKSESPDGQLAVLGCLCEIYHPLLQ
jgi:hypothetical protein